MITVCLELGIHALAYSGNLLAHGPARILPFNGTIQTY
jgi:hypothetical protein